MLKRLLTVLLAIGSLISCASPSNPPTPTTAQVPLATPTTAIALAPTIEPPTSVPTNTRVPVTPTFTPIPATTPRPTVTPIPPSPIPVCTFVMPTINPYCGPHESLQYSWFDQQTIPITTTSSLRFSAQTDGYATSARLVLAAGGQIVPMTNRGNGLWDATLTPLQLTCSYQLGKYKFNHSFVGLLEFFDGDVPETPVSLYININDNQIQPVTIRAIDAQAQKTANVANLAMPNLDRITPDVKQVTQKFYNYFGDNYDFLAVVYVPMRNENRFFMSVRHDAQGIGTQPLNRTAEYGSKGRLLGIVQFPLHTLFDLGATATSHEIGHQWINFLAGPKLPQFQGVVPHWPISSLANGIMGYQCCNNSQGLQFPYTFVPQANGNYLVRNTGVSQSFNDMELYLMGLLPASQVGKHFVFPDQKREVKNGETWANAIPFTVDDVIKAYGPRVPEYGKAQTKFRIATIVVSPSLLSPSEMAFFEYFAARGGSKSEMDYSAGHASGKTLPFYLATGKRGCLITTLDEDGGC